MKILVHKQELCTGCRACEVACSTAYFKTPDRNKSAIRIINNDNSFHARKCTQCGECIDMCTAHAIYRDKNGVVRIDKKLCVGCLGCVGYCSELVMFYDDDLTEPFKCIACNICVKACPENALEVLVSKAG
ncbi:MAG TPA: 4Fe-4S binding protein [Anaerolineaceae bacterium]|jgi:Fe-S-cluster-containing hydrogenase component 2|nr:4Fe-4S binding protein [Anaerolineaceae bacterium]HPT24108.1 4Fe-4S binding protein [Anaerolineaceae bacterium]